MKRKEEIDASCKFEDKQDEYWNKIVPDSKSFWDAYIFGYYAGVQWADKTTIDKACEWLRNFLKGPMGEGLAESIVDDFRKSLEE